MKTFAGVMGLPFGSAEAHTYPKSGQVAPPPPVVPKAQACEYSLLILYQQKHVGKKEYCLTKNTQQKCTQLSPMKS